MAPRPAFLLTPSYQPPTFLESAANPFPCHTSKKSSVTLIIATLPKIPSRKSFVCHTCEAPPGWASVLIEEYRPWDCLTKQTGSSPKSYSQRNRSFLLRGRCPGCGAWQCGGSSWALCLSARGPGCIFPLRTQQCTGGSSRCARLEGRAEASFHFRVSSFAFEFRISSFDFRGLPCQKP
jgi:hypothetical protein